MIRKFRKAMKDNMCLTSDPVTPVFQTWLATESVDAMHDAYVQLAENSDMIGHLPRDKSTKDSSRKQRKNKKAQES